MSSGVEVMISHAENLTRHLERVREDLNELRLKERLVADEPVTAGTLANGPTRLGNNNVGINVGCYSHKQNWKNNPLAVIDCNKSTKEN